MKSKYSNILILAVFGFLGGMFSQLVIAPEKSFAAASEYIQRFFDKNNKLRLDLGVYNNTPVQQFYGEDGKLRIQLGTYIAPGEKGLPFIGLSDNNGNLRMLFRLAGSNESPVIIMKDKSQRDRIVMGLAPSDADQEPFLAYFDKDGSKHMAFGKY